MPRLSSPRSPANADPRSTRSPSRSIRASIAALLVAVAATNVAHAAPEVAPSAEETRLGLVEGALAKDASSARLWYFAWSGFFAAASGTQLALALTTSDPGLRADTRVGAVTAGLGFLVTAALPPPSLFYSPCPTSDDAPARAACLARQEERLSRAASAERLGHSWLAHLGGIAVNVGAGLFLWRHDDRLGPGILTTVVGTLVCELQLFTAPTHARDAHDRLTTGAPTFAIAPTTGGGVLFAATSF